MASDEPHDDTLRAHIGREVQTLTCLDRKGRPWTFKVRGVWDNALPPDWHTEEVLEVRAGHRGVLAIYSDAQRYISRSELKLLGL